MKKLIASTFLVFCFAVSVNAQDGKKLKIFKFSPFSLITGSLNSGIEIFNSEKTKSTNLYLGIRYKNQKQNNNNYNYGGFNNSYEQFQKWQGVTLGVDRRLYVPAFQSGDKLKFINENGGFGIYFAPGIKGEYNVNKFDNSAYVQMQDPLNQQQPISKFAENTGKVQYISIMPNLNIGMQFTLFQNLYIDVFLGGGIRFLNKKVLEEKKDALAQPSYYYGTGDGAIETFITREGVQPNFGFSLGLKY
jgi:hypothetical protein